jgi:hypothetical protein
VRWHVQLVTHFLFPCTWDKVNQIWIWVIRWRRRRMMRMRVMLLWLMVVLLIIVVIVWLMIVARIHFSIARRDGISWLVAVHLVWRNNWTSENGKYKAIKIKMETKNRSKWKITYFYPCFMFSDARSLSQTCPCYSLLYFEAIFKSWSMIFSDFSVALNSRKVSKIFSLTRSLSLKN